VGGALIEDRHPEVEVGTIITGILLSGPNSVRFRFSAEVVRRDTAAKQIAIEFVDLSASLRRALAAATS
jgi:hypothetical protein